MLYTTICTRNRFLFTLRAEATFSRYELACEICKKDTFQNMDVSRLNCPLKRKKLTEQVCKDFPSFSRRGNGYSKLVEFSTQNPFQMDVTKTGNGERGAGSGERKSGNELSAETSTKIQNGGPKNEREKEEDKERNLCLG